MRNRLLWKILAINVPIVGGVIAMVWMTIDLLAADYFTELMKRYNISPDETHRMFLDAVHRYLIQATIAAMVLAIGLSYLLTRKALRPLHQMAEVTRRIAAGDYAARVNVDTSDEVGRLGEAFNLMSDSLERLEGLRRRMVDDIAHELRTPLTNLRGYLEGISDGVVPPSKETYGILQDEIMRLVRLVEDLQQLTKADAARAYLDRTDVALAALVDQALEIDRPRFEARRISIETDFDPDTGTVRADRDKLVQVLRNLIDNAWQYTPEGGRFRAATRRDGVGVTVILANSGPEIPSRDLVHLFERFYRPERSRSRDSGGAGIGLAIVKELVEAHGGSVGVESADGETSFRITLPA